MSRSNTRSYRSSKKCSKKYSKKQSRCKSKTRQSKSPSFTCQYCNNKLKHTLYKSIVYQSQRKKYKQIYFCCLDCFDKFDFKLYDKMN